MSTKSATRHYSIKGIVFDAESLGPGLHVTATPIGHLADISLRAVNALAAADEVLCEDTRVTGKLLHRYGITNRLVPYHDHNAAKLRPGILEALKAVPATLIFFESARRITAALADIAEMLGPRQVAMTRELTKLYEEAVRGEAGKVAALLDVRQTIKGEITLVVSPPGDAAPPSPEDIDKALLEASVTLPAGKAAADIAHRFGLAKRDLYARLLALKDKTAQ